MPAALLPDRVAGVKAITFFPGNEGTELDTHQGAVLLFEAERGRLLAMMDATSITAIRTAAVSGVATRLLAREDAGDLAILGSGTQARTHLEAMRTAREIRRVRVASKDLERARAFAERESGKHGIAIEPVASVREAVAGADIICTVTSSREPVLLGEWISPGAHVNAVGSSVPFARELDTAAVVRSRLYVDRRESALNEAGDFLIPKKEGAIGDDHIVGEIGEVLDRPAAGTTIARRGHALQVTRPRRRGRRVGAAHLREGEGVRDRDGSSTSEESATRTIEAPRSKTSAPRSGPHRGSRRIRTPLVRLNVEDAPAEIWLKLENLQPIGSFKLRGAGNAMRLAPREALAKGVYTASAGNMAQGVAWNARRLGIPCTVVVPDSAPQTKLAAIERLGARAVKLPFARWWQVLEDHGYPGIEGLFVHPVSDSAVIAGNGTIGLEILEDLPDVDAVIVPFGGGGLSCGIAAALRALRPEAKVFACRGRDGRALRGFSRRGQACCGRAHAELRGRHRRQVHAPGDVASRERAARGLARDVHSRGRCCSPSSRRAKPCHRRRRGRDFRGRRAGGQGGRRQDRLRRLRRQHRPRQARENPSRRTPVALPSAGAFPLSPRA